jgi:hypothetical protein
MYREVVGHPTDESSRITLIGSAVVVLKTIIDERDRSIDGCLRNRILFGNEDEQQNEQGRETAKKGHRFP